jgi:hypothetical protein
VEDAAFEAAELAGDEIEPGSSAAVWLASRVPGSPLVSAVGRHS